MINSLSLSAWKSFYFPLFVNDIFTSLWIHDWQLFFFFIRSLKMFLYCLVLYCFWQKSAKFFYYCPLNVGVFFLWFLLRFLTLWLVFSNLIIMCFVMVLFITIQTSCLIFVDFWICEFIAFIKFRKSVAIFFSNVFLSSIPFPQELWLQTGTMLNIFLQNIDALAIFSPVIFVFDFWLFTCYVWKFIYLLFCSISNTIKNIWYVFYFKYCTFLT